MTSRYFMVELNPSPLSHLVTNLGPPPKLRHKLTTALPPPKRQRLLRAETSLTSAF